VDPSSTIAKHVSWRTRLRPAIRTKEKVDVAEIRAEGTCELGRWLSGEGKSACRNVPEFAAVMHAHAAFDRVAARVAESVDAGDFDSAEKVLANGTDHARASLEVAKAIGALQERPA